MFDDLGSDLEDDDAADAGEPDALSAGAARGGKPEPAPEPAPDHDDLAIGEVSRVVRIADIARADLSPRNTPQPVRRSTQAMAVARGTGMTPKYDPAMLAASGDVLPPPLTGTEAELVKQLSTPAPKPSRHLLWLVGGIGVIAVVATVVIVLASRGGSTDDNDGPQLLEGGDLAEVSVSVEVMPQPRDPSLNPDTSGTGSNGGKTTTGGGKPSGGKTITGGSGKTTTGTGGQTQSASTTGGVPTRAGVEELTGTDVEDMSRKMSTGPRRCYEQAKRKDPFLDVKKVRAVISINPAGTVTKVELLDHANEQLDSCMQNALGRWKFRENSGGLTSQVSFQFMST